MDGYVTFEAEVFYDPEGEAWVGVISKGLPEGFSRITDAASDRTVLSLRLLEALEAAGVEERIILDQVERQAA